MFHFRGDPSLFASSLAPGSSPQDDKVKGCALHARCLASRKQSLFCLSAFRVISNNVVLDCYRVLLRNDADRFCGGHNNSQFFKDNFFFFENNNNFTKLSF